MTMPLLLTYLRDRIGLNPDSLGAGVVPDAVARRMRALNLRNLEVYVSQATTLPHELQALVDEIVVPETWFLRGGELFAYLANHVLGWKTSPPAGRASTPFRVLSVPCSTGEEPYSLALALAERGLLSAAAIDGADLSMRNLTLAQEACYGEFSFREMPSDLRQRYFRPGARGWEISAELRSAVRFLWGNLVDPLFLAGEAPYDLIFCRNLLIYLHASARQQALANLERLLVADGLLCMGHAEPLDLTDGRYQRVGPDSFFLYRRVRERPRLPAPGAQSAVDRTPKSGGRRPEKPISSTPVGLLGPSPDRRPEPLEQRPRVRTPVAVPAPLAPAEARQSPRREDALTQARERADAGKLAEAMSLCERELAQGRPSADLFSLMGVIHQARHAPDEAGACFRKALYLHPHHAEALMHLLLLCQQQGDQVQAELLRRRLERVRAGGEA